MKYVKKIVLTLVILFCLFYLITKPADAANAVRGAIEAVVGAVMAIFTFLATLSQ